MVLFCFEGYLNSSAVARVALCIEKVATAPDTRPFFLSDFPLLQRLEQQRSGLDNNDLVTLPLGLFDSLTKLANL